MSLYDLMKNLTVLTFLHEVARIEADVTRNGLFRKPLDNPGLGAVFLDRDVDPELADKERARLAKFRVHLVEQGLVSCLESVDRIVRLLGAKGYTYQTLGENFGELQRRIYDEFKHRKVFMLDPTKHHLFDGPNLFGDAVAERFPASIYDIEEAGKCLALGRSTACLFHLCRVLEDGLKALGKALEIPYAPSWDGYIDQIEKRIAIKHKAKGVKWKKDEPFFKEVIGILTTIKVAWRNPTMHIVRRYDSEEAEQVFNAVRLLMRRLAIGLPPATKQRGRKQP